LIEILDYDQLVGVLVIDWYVLFERFDHKRFDILNVEFMKKLKDCCNQYLEVALIVIDLIEATVVLVVSHISYATVEI
jgi:hypothetical protein